MQEGSDPEEDEVRPRRGLFFMYQLQTVVAPQPEELQRPIIPLFKALLMPSDFTKGQFPLGPLLRP